MGVSLVQILVFSLVAAVAVIAFSMQLNAPFREFPYIGITAFVTQSTYMVVYYNFYNILFATLISSLLLTIVSRVLAYNRRVPATVFLAPGFWPIAPGAIVYKATFCFINNNVISGQEFMMLSIQIAGAITIGLSIIFVIPQKYFNVEIPLLQRNRNGLIYE